jgi:hypothetical protein
MFFVPAPPVPMSFDPTAHQNNQSTFGDMFSVAGTFMGQVAKELKNDGLNVTHLTSFSPGTTINAPWLSDTKRAIVLLGWYNDAKLNGGHFIVASRRTRAGKIVYLDPWNGILREFGVGPQYQSTGRLEQIIYISA